MFVAAISPKGHGRNIATMPKPRPPPIKTGTLARCCDRWRRFTEAVWAARIADQVSNSPRADRPDELGVRSTEPLPFSVRPRPRTMQAAPRPSSATRETKWLSVEPLIRATWRSSSETCRTRKKASLYQVSSRIPTDRGFSYEPFLRHLGRPQTMQSGGQAFFSKEGIMFNRRASYEHRPRHGQHGAQMLRIQ